MSTAESLQKLRTHASAKLGMLRTDFDRFLKNIGDVDAVLNDSVEKLDRLEAYILSLKAYRNDLVPIARLPFDVLEQIFLELVAPYQRIPLDYFVRGGDWIGGPPKCIARVAAVCRTWRETALQCSRLWNHVSAQLPKRTIHQFLALCNDSLLSIHEARGDYALVFDQQDRLQHLYGIEGDGVLLLEYREGRFWRGNGDFPHLESLQVTYPTHPDPYICLSAILHARKLKRLTLCGAPFDAIKRFSTSFNALTVLSVRKMAPSQETIGLEEWLDLLSCLPSLEHLYLYGSLTRNSDAIASLPPPPARRVLLPRLRTLACKTVATEDATFAQDGFAALIAHLALPWETRIHVDMLHYVWQSRRDDAFVNDVRTLLECLDFRRSTALDTRDGPQRRREYTKATLAYGHESGYERLVDVALSGVCAADTPVDDLLTMCLPVVTPTIHPSGADALAPLLTTPLLSGVTTVSITNAILSADAWTALARAHPQIAHIRLTHVRSLVFLVAALEAAASASAVGDALLPGLRSLTLALAPPAPRVSGEPLPRAGTGRGLLLRLANVLAARTAGGLGAVDVDTGTAEMPTARWADDERQG